MQSEQGAPPIESTSTEDIADPGHTHSDSAEEANPALQILLSRYAYKKRKQSTSTEDKQPKAARKTVNVLADLIDGGEPDR
eukprot:849161-Karenia_brevis.AAC.1